MYYLVVGRRTDSMKENLLDELASVNEKMNELVDQMIEHYGKFVTVKEADKDSYAEDLLRSYRNLQEQKDYLENEISL